MRIQLVTVTESSIDTVVLSLRLKGSEAVRYVHVLEAAFKRNPYIDKSHAIRELLGLAEPSVLTSQEIAFFRTGNRKAKEETTAVKTVSSNSNTVVRVAHPPKAKKKRVG
jgi:hypothetical protein